ncbi:MAG: hypothetical protein BroJett030_18890 [Alphaproteobacteria bacterium]|nr:MAG: hypothetical protein BroJett030_18890 [Alphaproteobacteria bacterium]
MAWVGTPAFGQITPTAGAVAGAAAGQIIGAIRAEPDTPPRLDDSQTLRLFELALPQAAIAADQPPGVGEFALLIEVSAAAGRIARAYILAGTGVSEPAGLTAEQHQQARRNFLAFLPELTRIYDFRLLACARLADGAAAFVAATPPEAAQEPEVKAGLAAIEAEIGAVLAATISFVADPNIDRERRLARMRLLADNAARFARFFDLKQAEAIADQALAAAIAEKDAELADYLKDFALAMLR